MPHSQHLNGNNPVNDPDLKPVKGYSKFKPNRSLYQTMCFGLNTPHFAMEVVEGDKNVSVRVASDVDTMTLSAPLMTPVKMYKDYFFVPLRAILPNNAELLVTNPLSGDDIVAEDVNCGFMQSDLYSYMQNSFLNRLSADVSELLPTQTLDSQTRALRLVGMACYLCGFGDLFFSSQSLLNVLGHGNNWLSFGLDHTGRRITYDRFVDDILSKIRTYISSFKIDTVIPSFVNGYSTPEYTQVTVRCDLASDRQGYDGWSFRYFVEQLRQGMIVSRISDISLSPGAEASAAYLSTAFASYSDYNDSISQDATFVPTSLDTSDFPSAPRFINIGRLVAYQLASAQFYTSDTVDYIYSCNLWHNNMKSLAVWAIDANLNGTWPRYLLNGTMQDYDSVSAYVIREVLSRVTANVFFYNINNSAATLYDQNASTLCAWLYLHNIFSYTRSLKFRDYFVGSKVRPLAVGDVSSAVYAGKVNVVDITKNIQIQRFLNQVNRVGRTFKEYVQGIFGVTPMRDAHEVIFLGHTTDVIGAEETNNTGDKQFVYPQSTTSKLRKDSSQFAFEGDFSDPGILIGITNFDVVRPYTNSVDRQFYHVDRFDMFNPFLQQIGDQAVYGNELDNVQKMDNTDFGYQLRYAEFKQSVDRAVGGFVDFLPGYAFLNNRAVFGSFRSGVFTIPSISPDFIRSRSCEFDRFYLSLTHFSQAGYFHFIIRNDVYVSASRPMEAAPSIL